MLLMGEKGIGRGICHSIYWHAKVNNEYMKDYDKNKESSYIQYWYVNSLYGWAMLQKLPVNNFEWINYNEESDKGYFIKADVQYIEKLHERYNYLPFLPERMKFGKVEKLVANLHDKTEYVIHIRNWNQTLHNGLVF